MNKDNNKTAKKILIVKPSSLGDIFHVFPAVSLLMEHFPNAEFDWLVHPAFADILQYSPAKIRKTIVFPRRQLAAVHTFIPSFLKLTKELRQENYDLIIDFQGLFRSAFFAFIAKGSQVSGFSEPKESIAKYFYGQRITIPENCVHAVERNLALVRALTGTDQPPATAPLTIVEGFAKSAAKRLKDCGITSENKIIGVIPGARWKSKCWQPDFFTGIINGFRLLNPQYKFIILGSPEDTAAAKNIVDNTNTDNVISLAGKTSIGELVEAIRRCDFVISNDSGPIHIASALNKTVFGLFGPTDPEKTGPYGDRHIIFQKDLPCIKCLKRICPRGDSECHDLNIKEILSRLNEYINKEAVHEN
ncbi:MAG: lipopolysaccharide heptosyltransferase II [Victivallaceae bacterium]